MAELWMKDAANATDSTGYYCRASFEDVSEADIERVARGMYESFADLPWLDSGRGTRAYWSGFARAAIKAFLSADDGALSLRDSALDTEEHDG